MRWVGWVSACAARALHLSPTKPGSPGPRSSWEEKPASAQGHGGPPKGPPPTSKKAGHPPTTPALEKKKCGAPSHANDLRYGTRLGFEHLIWARACAPSQKTTHPEQTHSSSLPGNPKILRWTARPNGKPRAMGRRVGGQGPQPLFPPSKTPAPSWWPVPSSPRPQGESPSAGVGLVFFEKFAPPPAHASWTPPPGHWGVPDTLPGCPTSGVPMPVRVGRSRPGGRPQSHRTHGFDATPTTKRRGLPFCSPGCCRCPSLARTPPVSPTSFLPPRGAVPSHVLEGHARGGFLWGGTAGENQYVPARQSLTRYRLHSIHPTHSINV